MNKAELEKELQSNMDRLPPDLEGLKERWFWKANGDKIQELEQRIAELENEQL